MSGLKVFLVNNTNQLNKYPCQPFQHLLNIPSDILMANKGY